MIGQRQILHDFVAPPSYRPLDARDDAADDATRVNADRPIEWDRPILHIILDIGGARPLHIVAVHLRASRAAFVEGQKADAQTWRSMRGWAEGFFLASVKRAGQALEARLLVNSIFDDDPTRSSAVCGDFNADIHETPVRTIRGDEEDAGNPHLAARTLVPIERSVAQSAEFSVVHHGRPQMLDHLPVSRLLLGWYRSVEIHNEAPRRRTGHRACRPRQPQVLPRSPSLPIRCALDGRLLSVRPAGVRCRPAQGGRLTGANRRLVDRF